MAVSRKRVRSRIGGIRMGRKIDVIYLGTSGGKRYEGNTSWGTQFQTMIRSLEEKKKGGRKRNRECGVYQSGNVRGAGEKKKRGGNAEKKRGSKNEEQGGYTKTGQMRGPEMDNRLAKEERERMRKKKKTVEN